MEHYQNPFMKFMDTRCSVACVSLLLVGLALAPAIRADAPSTNAAPATAPAPAATPNDLLREAYQALAKNDMNTALEKATEAVKLDSRNSSALLLRGSIYAQQKQWTKASDDYDLALALKPDNVIVEFDQAELKFLQKNYDGARVGFAALAKDKDLGDLASYKVFLCDLFGGHEDVAQKELDVFNQIEGNPSYYFANAAWDLYHNKNEDAVGWLNSAQNIYANAPAKLANYSASLRSLGYIPVKLSSSN
jgi:tetratricopeptide (TPR) repeat protein